MITRDDEPIRVLMISPQFRPIVGGYERAAERLSAAFAAAGLRVVVITERRDRAWLARELRDGYEIRRLSCVYRRHLHAGTSLLSFAAFLFCHGRGFDVWHVHQYGCHAALAVALGKVLGRSVLFKLTNSAAMGIERATGRGFVGNILGFFQRRVSACLAVSEDTRKEAIRFGIPTKRIHICPNGVDEKEFRPASLEQRIAARRKLGVDCERLVLYVGRLSAEKNPLGLLEAWASLNPNPSLSTLLVLVGNGPEWNRLRTKIDDLNLTKSVYLAGSRSDVATWYQAADFYVNFSRNEGLSNTMIEAMASGLPVIATRVSGVEENLGQTEAGIVLEIGDVPNLANAMQTLIENHELCAKLGYRGRCVFEKRFTLEAAVSRVLRIYESLLSEAPSEEVLS